MTDRFTPQLQAIAALNARLDEQPDKLYAARVVATDAARALGRAKKVVADLEAGLADEKAGIMAMVTADKQFKNMAARQAEVARRMLEHARAKDFAREIEQAEVEVLNAALALTGAELKVKRLEDEQRSVRARVDLMTAEVQLLTAGR